MRAERAALMGMSEMRPPKSRMWRMATLLKAFEGLYKALTTHTASPFEYPLTLGARAGSRRHLRDEAVEPRTEYMSMSYIYK